MTESSEEWRTPDRNALSRWILTAASLPLLCCAESEETTAPQPSHTVTVTVTTRGVDFDGDGYLLVGPGGALRVGAQDSVVLNGLPQAAAHALALADLAHNCAVDGDNPVEVHVSPGSLEGSTGFQVLCSFDAGIAFTRFRQQGEPNHAVVSVDLPDLTLATPALEGAFAAWSRDGERLAYTRGRCPGTYDCLVNHVPEGLSIVRSDGTDRLDLTTGSDSNASWSPGGDELVFHRSEPQQPSFLYRIKTDGSGSAVRIDLPEEVLAAYEPSWSPQGNRLVFSCIVDGPPDLCVLDLDTGDWARVAVVHDGGEALEHPEWSPDGTRIAFRAWRVFDGDPTIAVVDADGTDLARLYTGQAPSWSPDGKRLVYEARLPIFGDAPNSGVGLRIVNVDGSELIVLTLEPLDWEPAWRP